MSKLNEVEINQSLFTGKFKSRFKGVLRWSDLDIFWKNLLLRKNKNWYIYKIGDSPPEHVCSADQFTEFIKEMNLFLRENHKEKYCGVVYVDDIDVPSFVKIFHPRNLGNGICSINKITPLPGWILSTLKPVDIATEQKHAPRYVRWWSRLVQAL